MNSTMSENKASALNLSVVIPLTEITDGVVNLVQLCSSAGCQVVMVLTEQAYRSKQQQTLGQKAEQSGADVRVAAASRGGQVAEGIDAAGADWIWVLHGDSEQVAEALAFLVNLSATAAPGWGRFDVTLTGHAPGLKLVAWAMNLRSRWTRICTGDQGMFFHRSLLRDAGGFPKQPLMEDIEISRRLRNQGVFYAPGITILTSGERWQRDGILLTVLRMWRWRLRYFFGVSADRLYAEYYGLKDSENS